MKKIVGKLLLILLVNAFVHADLVLDIVTSDDVPLKQAGIGQPFVIRVTDTSASGSIQQPEIQGIDNFIQQGNTFSMYTVNANSKIIYKYTVRVDKQGTYTIGPAIIKQGEELKRSNCLDIMVGSESIAEKQGRHHMPSAFMRLAVNKESLVVGERVTGSLIFYTPVKQQVTIQDIQPPVGLDDDFMIIKGDDVEQGEEEIRGEKYLYGKWPLTLYPKRSGSLVIPAWSVDYSVVKRPSFFSFMGLEETKRAYSNQIELHINPLPPHDPVVNAIGVFDSYVAMLDTTRINQGSGAVLQLKLTGNGNLDMIQHPVLTHVPDELRHYVSKSSLEGSFPNETKCFEYVIHGLDIGHWEIPAQQFVYFDTEEKDYKTLCSLPINLHVEQSGHSESQVEKMQIVDQVAKFDIHDLQTEYDNSQDNWALPNYLFIIFLLIPLLILLCWSLCVFFMWYCNTNKKLIAKHFAFLKAKYYLEEARRNGDYYSLRSLFIHLFAERLCCSTKVLSKEKIGGIVHRYYNIQVFSQWNSFFELLESIQFVHEDHSSKHALYDNACQWIHLFERTRI